MMAEIEQLLKAAIGLNAASVGRSMIEHAVRARMAVCGIGKQEAYWEKLRNSASEMHELIETVVVPETSFFRDREAFFALAKIVTNDWLPAHFGAVLRILSAPCSTGEEPFSIAMALMDTGLAANRFKIDAVDISVRALALADRASFGRNSFRHKDLAFRDAYFQVANERYQLAEPIRARVRFEQGNLLDPDFLIGRSYDIIFCRNVLIYFDDSTQARVLKKLDRLLAPDGFLFVGSSESFVARATGFTSVDHPQAFAYRKTKATPKPAAIPVKPSRKKTKAAIEARPAEKPKTGSAREISPVNLETAGTLADAGRLAEAAAACETHVREQGATAAAYYLLGLLSDSVGDQPQAFDFYRKALYLEPNHVDALTHLALLTEKTGDAATAQRLHRRAKRAQQISNAAGK